MAKQLCVTGRTIFAWESGKNNPSSSNIRAISEILGVSVREISNVEDISLFNQNNINTAEDLFSIERDFSYLPIDKSIKLRRLINEVAVIKHENNLLTLNNKRLSAIFNSLKISTYVIDKNFRFVNVNNSFTALCKINRELILGKKITDVFSYAEETIKNLIHLEQNVFNTGINLLNEEIVLPGSNNKKFGYLSLIPLEWDNGKVNKLLVCIKDLSVLIIEGKKQKIIKSMLDQFDECVWMSKKIPFSHHIFLAGQFEKIYGYPKKNFIENSKFWFDIAPEEDKPELSQKVDEAIKNNKLPLVFQKRILHPDGKIRWIDTHLYRSEQDKNILFGRASDITEKHRKVQAFEVLSQVIDKSATLVWIGEYVDNDQKVFEYTYLTSHFEKMTGMPNSILKKKSFFWYKSVYKSDKNAVSKWLKKKIFPKEITFTITLQNLIKRRIKCTMDKNKNIYYGTVVEITE
jgi:PAS domain S-box-containing protein